LVSDTAVHLIRDNFLIAKIRGERSHLLESQQIKSLAEAHSREELVGLLVEGPYGAVLSKLEPNAPATIVERSLFSNFSTSLAQLRNASSGDTRRFLGEYEHRLAAYDLAALISFKAIGASWDEYIATRRPMSLRREQELRRLYSMEDVYAIASEAGDRFLVDHLRGFAFTDLQGEKLALAKDIVVAWGEERFYKYVTLKLKGADRKNCQPIIGSIVDVTNVLIILRSKLIGSTDIRTHLVSSRWKLDRNTVDQLITIPDVSQGLEVLASHYYYQKIFGGARQKYEDTKSLAFVESVLPEHLLHLSKRIFLGFPYSVGIVLAFLLIKENEARNLEAVFAGVEAGLPAETIRSNLVLRA
jgi:vacuolar-type H+-ATPase subunit C/Vma6